MFGHQNDQQGQDTSQSMDHGVNAIINNDVTPPPSSSSFLPPASEDRAVDPAGTPAQSTDLAAIPPIPDLIAASDLDGNGLLDIKQKALTQLSPLVGHLEQTPEEKFRTTMMMIQASDNQGLIKDAFEAAQNISDEKIRAQALLDVINEINYFTQHAK